jgi:hypothetical protein
MRLFHHFSKPIKLYWWVDPALGTHGNFGDEITKYLMTIVFNKKVVRTDPDKADIIGAGSLLTDVYNRKGSNRPYVWSTGFIENNGLNLTDEDFKYCAVRGKVTQSRISSNSNIALGDAGLLASYLLQKKPAKKYKLGIIPHYIDKDSIFIENFKANKDIVIIDPTNDCMNVVQDIAQCDYIVSSSLHGLILSDSLGVPNRHIILSDKVTGGEYKFNDYYSVFDKERYNPLRNIIISEVNIENIIQGIESTYIVPSDIDNIKKTIFESFPY